MTFRIFILSVACLSCLPPPAQGLHELKAAAAVGALPIKGAAIKGANAGAAAKTAALLCAKGAIKDALAPASHAATLAVHKLPPVKPVIVEKPHVVVPSVIPANAVLVKTRPPRVPPVSNSLTSLLKAARSADRIDTASALASLRQPVVDESLRYPYPLTALDLIDNYF